MVGGGFLCVLCPAAGQGSLWQGSEVGVACQWGSREAWLFLAEIIYQRYIAANPMQLYDMLLLGVDGKSPIKLSWLEEFNICEQTFEISGCRDGLQRSTRTGSCASLANISQLRFLIFLKHATCWRGPGAPTPRSLFRALVRSKGHHRRATSSHRGKSWRLWLKPAFISFIKFP